MATSSPFSAFTETTLLDRHMNDDKS